jgi:hypothetical protein
MSHRQDVQCRSDRIGDISTLPFLTRVPRRCSTEFHPFAPLGVITPSWGTECILFSPTTLGSVVHSQCLLAPA